MLIAIGVSWEGRGCGLAVELANRGSESSWQDFLMGLKERGLCKLDDLLVEHKKQLLKHVEAA